MDTRPVYTLSSKPEVLASHDEAVERARDLKDRLRERLREGDTLRRLPDQNVADILESGLYGVMKPKRYGGSELGTETLIDVTIELASADPSTGWVYMLWAAHMWLQALWPVKALDEMWANPNSLASSVVSTVGDVTKVDGGYHWTGHGLFSSGVDHCDWLTAAVPIKEGGERIDHRWLLIPREDLEIIDDWHTVGLRGTGSKTIVVNDLFVPEYRSLSTESLVAGEAPGREVNTHPMYGAPVGANFTGAMSVPALGAAKGLVELFRARLESRVQTPDRTNSPYAGDGMAITMARFAEVAASLDASYSLLLWNASHFACAPAKDVSPLEAEKMRRDMTFTAQEARRAANRLYEACGGSGLDEGSLLQHFWRDTNAAAAHRGLTWDWQGDSWTKAAVGLPVTPLM
ncbi:MAG: acyl-CoA dehydrogenase family protein [Acidimicrobiaceae bacterium]|nr:acyl-CoA dehydrogenase family protein [Acidimicrobiaceae bacterium]MBO0746818.1 acyl-CoA dehydrogenase family protein [Acidimicrobiaceae bacterium]